MKRKKASLSPDWRERHERTQKMLADRIAYHEQKLAEERGARAVGSGEPSHFEVGVPDARRARAFYGELLGWSFRTTRGDDAWIETRTVGGGLHGQDDAASIRVYFSVPDIQAAVSRVRQLGGEADEPGPADLSGRYVSCRDDQGVPFGLHEPPRSS